MCRACREGCAGEGGRGGRKAQRSPRSGKGAGQPRNTPSTAPRFWQAHTPAWAQERAARAMPPRVDIVGVRSASSAVPMLPQVATWVCNSQKLLHTRQVFYHPLRSGPAPRALDRPYHGRHSRPRAVPPPTSTLTSSAACPNPIGSHSRSASLSETNLQILSPSTLLTLTLTPGDRHTDLVLGWRQPRGRHSLHEKVNPAVQKG